MPNSNLPLSPPPTPLRQKSATSREVAKLAGVSQSTVSRVFIDSSAASPATRQKVLDAAKALNYRPNAFARSLTTRESKLIGLVFPDTDYPVHMHTLQELSKALQQHNYSAVLMPWELDSHQQHSIPNIFQYKVDGVIAASAQANTALYDECRELNIPVVQFARVEQGTINHCSAAISDNYGAGKSAARLFVNSGAKSPAYITGDIPSYTDNERREGFIDGCVALTGQKPRIINTSYLYDSAASAIRALLQSSNRPDACFCATDIIAMALMDVARHQFNLSIPEQLQVIGFDDIPQSSWLSYQLTTFQQDFSRLAKESVKVLLDHIRQPSPNIVKLMVSAELITRKTTR